MAVFEKFGDETDINLPAESIEKKGIFIIRQYPAEIGITPIFDHGKIMDLQGYRFQWQFLTSLVTKLTLIYQLNQLKWLINRLKIPCQIGTISIFDCGKLLIFRDIIFYGCFGYNISS